MSKQLDAFKTHLETFAANHKNDIKKNPEFRGHFQKMCARIGVDPLACEYKIVLQAFSREVILSWEDFDVCSFVSASKGFWAEMLGVGDFYYEVPTALPSPFSCNVHLLFDNCYNFFIPAWCSDH